MFKALHFQPGIVKDSTAYANGGGQTPGWWDCNFVRFRMGFPESWGGWVRVFETKIIGIVRNMFQWTLLNGDQLVAIGSEKTVCLMTISGIYDTSPIEKTYNPTTAVLNGGVGSTIMFIWWPSHGAEPGNVISIKDSGNAPGAGSPVQAQISQRWVVMNPYKLGLSDPLNIVAVDVWTEGTPDFTSATPFGTGSTIRLYEGGHSVDSGILVGWGAGPWGGGTWGEGIPVNPDLIVRNVPTTVSFDNYGQQLLWCRRGQPINIWDPGFGYDQTGYGDNGRSQPLASQPGANGVPDSAFEIMVSEQSRIVIAFAVKPYDPAPIAPLIVDPMLFRWSDQENNLDWVPTTANAAGELHLQGGSYFVTATKTRREILAWTDHSLNSIQFIAGDLIFGVDVIARGISIAGPMAKMSVGDDVFWMGVDNFYRYSGTVKIMPCPVLEYVFGRLRPAQLWKVTAAYEPAHNELKWFFPSRDGDENDRYVALNVVDMTWTVGELKRSAWVHQAFGNHSLGASLDEYIYVHEAGLNDGSTNPASPVKSFITSSPTQIGEGDHFMIVWRILSDITFRNSTADFPKVTLTIDGMEDPGSAIQGIEDTPVAKTNSLEVVVEQFTPINWIRIRSRMARLTVRNNDLNVSWRLGVPRIDARPDGQR